ncbi:hypothetical protein PFFCH_01919 [Plasmodium falciparum FCH/4]|uniref:Uncharacterized protein n=1 Tax=Plasmodium falciparum FCH/4 TaxID=1036724 RepID=A0A024VQ47_PLAFA|nr:hypothetical protein PFFCH_01919 [Plasmodium falciparum FCH/4]
MSLNFSDDDDVINEEVDDTQKSDKNHSNLGFMNNERKEKEKEKDYGMEKKKPFHNYENNPFSNMKLSREYFENVQEMDVNNEENYIGPDEGSEVELEGKKKKKKSVIFQLKNLFNDVSLNKLNTYIRKRRRKSQEEMNSNDHFSRSSYEKEGEKEKNNKKKKRNENGYAYGEDNYNDNIYDNSDDKLFNDSYNNMYNDDILNDQSREDVDVDVDEEDELQKYVREEKNKMKQIMPEKDELWELYIYMNLKKKKRKIEYNEKQYSNAMNKVFSNLENEYKSIIKEKLFGKIIFKEYLVISDDVEYFKNNHIMNIGKNMTIPIIKKKNLLSEMKRKLILLYNKGICCNYIKEISINSGGKINEQTNSYQNQDGSSLRINENMDYYINKIQDNNLIIEKESLNLYLNKLFDKYCIIVHKIRTHRRKDLRMNFNSFMDLINEVFTKLYFSIHNIFLTDEDMNINLTDIYKTIRRKYNMHDVLDKVQKLTHKKECYEHYRSYLLYKYKTTYSVCDEAFKNHIMNDNINIFNFKKFYNTDFSKENFTIIKEEQKINTNDNDFHHFTYDQNNAEEHTNIFTNDIYNEDFFSINVNNMEAKGIQPPHRDTTTVPEKSYNAKTKDHITPVLKEEHAYNNNNNNNNKNNNNNNNNNKNNNNNNNNDNNNNNVVEETPLEKAKRIAREKKKQLMNNRVKII